MTDTAPCPVSPAPDVAVLIAAWNAEATLPRAIRTALAQTAAVEVVVVDDHSSDGTWALLQGLAQQEPRLTVLRQPENRGPSAARNRAMAASRAPWVAVLDSDDWMEPDRLAQLLALAKQHQADFIGDDLWKQHEGTPETERHAMLGDFLPGAGDVMALSAAEFIFANLSSGRDRYGPGQGRRREMGFLKPLMSRAFLERQALVYDPQIRLGEDYVLYAQALIAGARFLLTRPLGYVAVVRPNSLSGRHPTEAHAHLIAADRAMLARPDLPQDTRRALCAHLLEQRKKWAWRRMIDAVRRTDAMGALRCFWGPPQVGFDLLGRLGREALSRLKQRLTRGVG